MDKKKIINEVSEKTGIKKKKLNAMTDYVFKSVIRNIVNNKIAVINNFGEFRLIRRKTRIIEDKHNVYIVIPPASVIIFNLFGKNDTRNEPDGTEEIINGMMIKFSLNADEARKIFDNIFSFVKESLLNGKKFKAELFGEFKSVKLNPKDRHAEVVFKSSKNLKAKTNYEFDNLKVCRIYIQKPEVFEEKEKFEFKISEEFRSKIKNFGQSEVIHTSDIESETMKMSNNLKRLISEELLKLHREITDLGIKAKLYNDINLWR